MKQLLPIFLFLFLSFQISAQDDLVVNPNPNIQVFEVDLDNNSSQVKIHGVFVNTSNDNMSVKWQVVPNGSGCPSEWDYQVCDANQCYIWGVLSNEGGPVNVPVELAPGDSSILDLYIRPNGVGGCCNPNIFLSHFDDPTNVIATAEYDICIESATAVTEREKANLRVYPTQRPIIFHFLKTIL